MTSENPRPLLIFHAPTFCVMEVLAVEQSEVKPLCWAGLTLRHPTSAVPSPVHSKGVLSKRLPGRREPQGGGRCSSEYTR